MDKALKSHVALITGASRGIGRAIALRLAQAQVTVVLVARTVSALDVTANEIRIAGGEVVIMPGDVTHDEQVTTLVHRVVAQLGHIDILVNNAGGGPPRTPVVQSRLSDWEWTLRVNLWATMHLTRLIVPDMITRRSGTIINIASLAALSGKGGEAAYAAAKFGVRGFSQSLFEEVREFGVKVCTVCPGYVDTNLIPPNRRVDRNKMLSPQDVAEAVYSAVVASPRSCPTEVILQPQYDPMRTENVMRKT